MFHECQCEHSCHMIYRKVHQKHHIDSSRQIAIISKQTDDIRLSSKFTDFLRMFFNVNLLEQLSSASGFFRRIKSWKQKRSPRNQIFFIIETWSKMNYIVVFSFIPCTTHRRVHRLKLLQFVQSSRLTQYWDNIDFAQSFFSSNLPNEKWVQHFAWSLLLIDPLQAEKLFFEFMN